MSDHTDPVIEPGDSPNVEGSGLPVGGAQAEAVLGVPADVALGVPADAAAVSPTAPTAPSESAAEAAPIELAWRRLHPLSPLLRGGLVLIVVAGILIANLRDQLLELVFAKDVVDAMGPNEGDLIDYLAGQRLLIWALVAVVAVVLVIVGVSWLSWRFSTFRITADAVESQRGVLFRQHRRAPLERIQSVNLQRSLLARLLGLTQVDVQTAGQGGKVELQYLGHRDAKEVREQILLAAKVSKSGGADPSVANAQAHALHSLQPGAQPDPTLQSQPGAPQSSIAGSPFSPAETSAAHLAVDYAGQAYAVHPGSLDGRLRDLADFDIDPSARDSGTLIKVPLGRLIASLLLGSEMLSIIIVAAAIIVVSISASPYALAGLLPVGIAMVGMLISQFNKGFNFVLSRAEDGVRVGAGLTATTTETIPFGRVHAVEARQPIGWRPLGWWKVRITTAGHSAAQAGQNKLQNVVLPVGTIDDVLRVFETLLHDGDTRGSGEAAADGIEDRRLALGEALVGAGDGFLGAGPRAGWLLWFGKRRAGLRIENDSEGHASLRIRRGWLTRSLSVMPIVRAQSIQLSRPMVHRMLGLASLQAHTVLGPVRMQMRGIALDDARRAFDELAATVVGVQTRDALQRGAGEVADAGTSSAGAPGFEVPSIGVPGPALPGPELPGTEPLGTEPPGAETARPQP